MKKPILPLVLLVSVLMGMATSFSQPAATPPGTGPSANIPGMPELRMEPMMNGHRFEEFANFQKNWHLVTVRYRKDTGEMRITYANEPAWKALLAGETDYPDGAIFGKVGLMTMQDPAFESSAVPEGARRYQFMIRDRKKYAETNGWGYALFNDRGMRFPSSQTDHEEVLACDACHQGVKERGYVFSQLMPLDIDPANKDTIIRRTTKTAPLSFETVEYGRLPQRVQSVLPREYMMARRMTGAMVEKIFQGTIDEIRPALIKEALTANLPAVLTQEDGTLFAMVYPTVPCVTQDKKNGMSMAGYFVAMPTVNPESHPIVPIQPTCAAIPGNNKP